MSLEKQIAELTAAVNNLATVFGASAAQLAQPVESAPVQEAKPEPKKETAKAPAKKAEPKKEEPAKAEPKAETKTEEAPAEEDSGVSFDEVRTATRELGIARDRETVVALLADFGVGKASELEPAKYAEYVARARAAMAETDDLSE